MASSSSELSFVAPTSDLTIPKYWYLPVFAPLKQKLKADEREQFDDFLMMLAKQFDHFHEDILSMSSLEFIYGLIDKSFQCFERCPEEHLSMTVFSSHMFFIALIVSWYVTELDLERREMYHFVHCFNKLKDFHKLRLSVEKKDLNKSVSTLVFRGFKMFKEVFNINFAERSDAENEESSNPKNNLAYGTRIDRANVEKRMAEQGISPIVLHALQTLPEGGLCDAVRRNDIEEVKKFLLLHWNANENDKNGKSALSIAIASGYIQIVELLLSVLDKNQPLFPSQLTPIYFAAAEGQLEIVKKLIDMEVNYEKTDMTGATPLFIAAERGHVEVVQALIAAGAQKNTARIVDGKTPLLIAAANRHQKVVELLLSAGADFTIADTKTKMTLLHMVACSGYQDLIEWLLAAGVSVDIAARNGKTPLMYAAETAHPQVVEQLIEHGASIRVVAIDGTTLLHAAAFSGNEILVERLLASGLDINQRSITHGYAPLFYAAMKGHVKIVTRLLQAGASIDVMDNKGLTPLDAATNNGHLEAVKVLLEADNGALEKLHSSKSPLFRAIQKGHARVVNFFIEVGCDVNAVAGMSSRLLYMRNAVVGYPPSSLHADIFLALGAAGVDMEPMEEKGISPLCVAIYIGHAGIVERLLSANAEKSINDDNGYALLLLAIERGHCEVVRLLVGAGVRLKPTYEDIAIPLHEAVANGKGSIVAILLNAGADPNSKDDDEKTPLYLAAEEGFAAIAAQLIESGADINAPCIDEDVTPLHIAAIGGHTRVVDLLLSKGAMLEAVTTCHETPLCWAVKGSGASLIVRRLISEKANTQVINCFGSTLLILAALENHSHIFSILLSAILELKECSEIATSEEERMIVNQTNHNGETPLHIAAQEGNKLIVRQLLEVGANRNIALPSGKTALCLAKEYEHRKVVEMLEEEPVQFYQQKKLGR
jgi:ankyrin repeat protein